MVSSGRCLTDKVWVMHIGPAMGECLVGWWVVFLGFFFCQTHHCGAFIQKHSSIVTIFTSLMRSHVFVWFFPSHVHPALCLYPLVTVFTIFVFKLFTIIIKHFGAWADFQISWTIGRKALVFLYILIHIFVINITWFIRLAWTFP